MGVTVIMRRRASPRELIITTNRYIATETAISIAINVALSALFVMLLFGRSETIDLWGAHGLAVDFVPQTFMIAAMSVLVPTLLTRKRMRNGALFGLSTRSVLVLPRNVLGRALLVGLALTLVMGGAATALLRLSWHGPLAYWDVFTMKLAYGALVALVATPLSVASALTDAAGTIKQL